MPKPYKKLIPLSRIMINKDNPLDSVKSRKGTNYDKRNLDLLYNCAVEWTSFQKYRDKRARNLRYVYGEQWSDPTYNKTQGKVTTEKQWIIDQGNVPFVNNVIRNKVNTVVGAYVKNQTEPIANARDREDKQASEMMSIALQANWQINKMPTVLAMLFEEFLASSVAVGKEYYGVVEDKLDSWTFPVNTNYLCFTSTMKDPRHIDITMICEIHDEPYVNIVSKFCKNQGDSEMLSSFYSLQAKEKIKSYSNDASNKHYGGMTDFYTPRDLNLCRYYEVWTLELKPRYRVWDKADATYNKIEIQDLKYIDAENKRRIEQGTAEGIPEEQIPLMETEWFVDSYWYYQFLTPQGNVIAEGETPYEHKSHPYTIKCYPFVNGEIHSYVEDKIDLQRSINRNRILQDMVIKHGAKGLLMISTENIPDTMTPDQFAEQYVATDGLLIYKPNANRDIPKQVYANSSSAISTISSMIQMDMQLLEEQGTSGAIQGATPTSGTSASLYALQTQNSTASLAGIFQAFSQFTLDISKKKAMTIRQFYTDKRMISISGKTYSGVNTYDPKVVKDTEYDFSITESAASPILRMVANDQLMQFYANKDISLDSLLTVGDFPFADSLKMVIEKERKEAAEAQAQMQQTQQMLQQEQQQEIPQ